VERAERTPSIVQADRLARALETSLSAMLVEVEREEGGSSRIRSPSTIREFRLDGVLGKLILIGLLRRRWTRVPELARLSKCRVLS
jgi:hypothetical protein